MQGIILKDGVVYENEHGPMGGDELNIAESGKNYGWPAITYGKDYSGATISFYRKRRNGAANKILGSFHSAFWHGLLYWNSFSEWTDSIFVSALVPGDVRRLKIKGSNVLEEEILFSDLGRIRDVATSPDGSIILATDGPNGKIN